MSDLEDKIKKELLKSGFPLEVFCQRTLVNNKWTVYGPQEISINDDITKEIDILALTYYRTGRNSQIVFTLHLECKKNRENPWVFFKENKSHNDFLLVEYVNLDFSLISHKISRVPRFPISEMKEHHFRSTPSSSIYTMAFKIGTNQIYEAVSSVISSAQFLSEFRQKHRKDRNSKNIIISVYYLTIVFDGKLYIADVVGSDNVELSETQHLIYYHQKAEFPKHKHYNIEIVTRDYFDTYLKILNKDNETTVKLYEKLLPQIASEKS